MNTLKRFAGTVLILAVPLIGVGTSYAEDMAADSVAARCEQEARDAGITDKGELADFVAECVDSKQQSGEAGAPGTGAKSEE